MIDFSTQFTDQDGEIVKQNFKVVKLVKGKAEEKNTYRALTLEDIARTALLKSD